MIHLIYKRIFFFVVAFIEVFHPEELLSCALDPLSRHSLFTASSAISFRSISNSFSLSNTPCSTQDLLFNLALATIISTSRFRDDFDFFFRSKPRRGVRFCGANTQNVMKVRSITLNGPSNGVKW
jgi:hypothetical protein